MASANTGFMVHSKFVAVGMNMRIIHLNHASIIKLAEDSASYSLARTRTKVLRLARSN